MCGVFGITNHKDAANLVYLGLYALQHRGQESAGIASASRDPIASDTNIGEAVGSSGASEFVIAPGTPQIHSEKEMGYVADIFTHERLARLPGDIAIRWKNSVFYFPVGTCIALSVVLSLVMSLF